MMGRFIAKFTRPSNHLTFIATHSSHVLRGILEAETETRITVVRLTRKSGEFCGTMLDETSLLDCIRNPRTKAEAILDGLFSNGVIIVESEGDREVYQAAAESIDDHHSREVRVIPMGGTGGFAGPLKFFRKLAIPVAAIADLDAICDTPKMIACVEALCSQPEIVQAATDAFVKLANMIKALPPSITQKEVLEELEAIGKLPMEWTRGDDNKIRRRLNELQHKISRVSKLKEGGIEAYLLYNAIHIHMNSVIEASRQLGLFFVCVGELENWVPEFVPDHSKRRNKFGKSVDCRVTHSESRQKGRRHLGLRRSGTSVFERRGLAGKSTDALDQVSELATGTLLSIPWRLIFLDISHGYYRVFCKIHR